ncbi:MAG TPA: exodeoxyribonuclease VII large subunit [Ktedonobacterales bacterium]|nr:exodeoxyribonuclease VII large subunit [Ktedonobacterales bacterium]
MRIVAVSELTRYIKDVLEEDFYLQDIWVRGELTNLTQPASGHRYFSLKDETATLRCVLFRGHAGFVPPLRNGMAVLAHGRISIFEQRGDYQFYVDAVEDAGIGELHRRFEALKARLEAEGLFAPERKRALPPCPAVVGVVTSASAAALRDIVRTLRLRCPLVRVVLMPALVQGEGAAEQVTAALDALNAHGEADVILVARGGGSLEELWAFNEEVVARAIARSAIPVVTGIGHETDFTIADFVADLRASTPTAAATAVVPDASAWRDDLDAVQARLDYLIATRLTMERDNLRTSLHQLDRASPERRILDARQHVDESHLTITRSMGHLLAMRDARLHGAALRLHALSPLQTLGRGFAVVRRQSDGALVTSVAHVSPGQGITVRVADGTFAAIASARIEGVPADVAHANNTQPASIRAAGAHARTHEADAEGVGDE